MGDGLVIPLDHSTHNNKKQKYGEVWYKLGLINKAFVFLKFGAVKMSCFYKRWFLNIKKIITVELLFLLFWLYIKKKKKKKKKTITGDTESCDVCG